MKEHRDSRVLTGYRQHMSWLETARDYLFLIALVNIVDEGPIPCRRRIKIMSKSSINKNINHIAKADKKLEMKVIQQERQDVLRADALKTLSRTIPVFV